MKNLEVMSYYKALLAPLQFGAGIKGFYSIIINK